MSEVRGTNCDRKSLAELIMAVSGLFPAGQLKGYEECSLIRKKES